MRRCSALLFTLLLPALAAAQTRAPSAAESAPLIDQLLAPGAAPATLDNLQAMPLWGTPDGHVLAIVALGDSSIPALPRSPQIGSAADWKFVDVTNFVTSGVLLNLTRGQSAYATFGRGALLGPLATQPCAVAPGAAFACADSGVVARLGSVQVGSDMAVLDNVDLDLSYGLSWLHRDLTAVNTLAAIDLFGAVNHPQFPTLLLPGLEMASVQNASVNAIGHWRMDDSSLDLGASVGRLQLYAPNAPPLTSLNQAAVTFGLRHGAFSGSLTGHVLGPAESFTGPSRWAGLDIGFSWRTPWQGELIFGTQNLWSSGFVPNLSEPGTREVESSQARVPYVQYHQDL